MNNLCRLSHVKRDIGGVGALSNTSDTVLGILQAVEDVSREFESETGRSFAATLKTIHIQRHQRACPDHLWLPEDVASISSLTVDNDGDGTYELTLVEDTDYWAEREVDGDSNTPIVRLVLNPDAATVQLSSWPTRYRAVRLTGFCGYSNERESTLTTTAEAVDDTETAIDVVNGSLIDPGDTISFDSDDEQCEVLSVSGNTITVTRGINGTTAAAHANGATVYRRRYPRRVENAVKERAVGMRWDTQMGHAAAISLGGETDAGGVSASRASYARWRRTVASYRRWEVA